jgi:Zn-finger nucleic acid-binding protein
MSQLMCPSCHLALSTEALRAQTLTPEYCPRCLGRRGIAVTLLELLEPSRGAAGRSPAGARPQRTPASEPVPKHPSPDRAQR